MTNRIVRSWGLNKQQWALVRSMGYSPQSLRLSVHLFSSDPANPARVGAPQCLTIAPAVQPLIHLLLTRSTHMISMLWRRRVGNRCSRSQISGPRPEPATSRESVLSLTFALCFTRGRALAEKRIPPLGTARDPHVRKLMGQRGFPTGLLESQTWAHLRFSREGQE